MTRDMKIRTDLSLDVRYTQTSLSGHTVREQVTLTPGDWSMSEHGVQYYSARRTIVLIPWSKIDRLEQFQ